MTSEQRARLELLIDGVVAAAVDMTAAARMKLYITKAERTKLQAQIELDKYMAELTEIKE